MSATAVPRRRPPAPGRLARAEVLVPLGVLLLGVLLDGVTDAHRRGPVPDLLRGTLGSLVLLLVSGEALARILPPQRLRPLSPLLAVPFGFVASGLALTAFGVAHVPLGVSLWLVLALGVGASLAVRRRAPAPRVTSAGPSPRSSTSDIAALPWIVTAIVLFGVALIPVVRLGFDTVLGQNPDASQVVGIATLFQHVPPTHTDVALPLDSVPSAWRFRYPIFYPLAAASSLVHFDPIRVFPVLSALLVAAACLGFALLAVDRLGVPPSLGPAVAGVLGFSWVLQHLAWHPYWNQLWGLTLFPYALLFGWRALEDPNPRDAALAVLFVFTLWFAYPLAVPYPLVILVALAVGIGRRPHLRRPRGARAWLLALGATLLAAAVLGGAGLKLVQGLHQILVPSSSLWGGDVVRFLPFGDFVGTGGGAIPALLVAAVALGALVVLPAPRRIRIAFGTVLLALALLDLRFRLTTSGTYMDFKHLSFVGSLVLTVAAAGVLRLIHASPRRWMAILGVALSAAWLAGAVVLDRTALEDTGEQVDPAMLQVRTWIDHLPRGASVRIDIPADSVGGFQLWMVYMAGSHPVDTPNPVLAATYDHARQGVRADYALSMRGFPLPPIPAPFRRLFPANLGDGPIVDQNVQFVLRRVVWPRRFDAVPDTASQRLVP